ncbi:MAG: AAA family ATPase [Gemmatimonadales bacterium]
MPLAHASSPRHADPGPALRLRTLGALSLTLDRPGTNHHAPPLLIGGKAIALVTYLLCSPGRSASRDLLVDQFWNDADPVRGRHALRQLILRLRQQLGASAITSEAGRVILRAPVRCDRDEFRSAIEEARFLDAVKVYEGDFFSAFAAPGAGEFETWAEGERTTLRLAFLRAAREAATTALDEADYRSAIAVAIKARTLCPGDQSAWRLLIEAYLASGNTAPAQIEADSLRALLGTVGDQPEPATLRLLERLRGPAKPTRALEPWDPLAAPELVGRTRAFASLTGAWDACQRLGAQHVHVTGPAGLGKSRLLGELASRLRHGNGQVAMVRARPADRDRPGAFLADLATALGTLDGLKGASPASLAELVALAPSVSGIIDPKAGHPRPQATTTAQILALVDIVGSVAETRSLALLMDDLHWADLPSQEILQGVTDRVTSSRVLIVTASREGSPLGTTRIPSAEIALQPLSPPAIAALVASLGADPADPCTAEFAAAIHATSTGSPLMALSLLRGVLQRGYLLLETGSWTWQDFPAALRLVQESDPLARQIEALDAETRRILLCLAATGGPVDTEDLVAACHATPSALQRLEVEGLALARVGKAQVAHDAVGTRVLELADPGELKEMHVVLATRAEAHLERDEHAYYRAASHLRLAGEPEALQRLFHRRVRMSRRRRDGHTPDDLARLALGSAAGNEEVRALVRTIPATERLLFTPSRRLGLATAAGLLVLLPFVSSGLGQRAPEPEAELLVAAADRPGGDRISLYAVPVRRDRWQRQDSISPSEIRRLRRLPPGVEPYTTFVALPGARQFAFDRFMPDSGGIDLFLLDHRNELVRLTATVGDDFAPTVAPDGSGLAFATARWTPRGDENADIAMLNLFTGEIRQLTHGRDYDTHPVWSADGTRVAFSRRHAESGEAHLCVITVDGTRLSCSHGVVDSPLAIAGWVNDSTIVATRDLVGPKIELVRWHTGVDDVQPHKTLAHTGRCEPRYVWYACLGADPTNSPAVWISSGETEKLLPLYATPEGRVWMAWLPAVGGERSLEGLSFVGTGTSAYVGLTHHLTADGHDRTGASRPVPRGVMHWLARDTAVAVIDSVTGVLTPRRSGSVWITASAGGWRTDSLRITILEPESRTVFREDWADLAMPHWEPGGDPSPQIAPGPGGALGLLNNGDAQFDSGVFTRTRIPSPMGMGFEAIVSTPLTSDKWQSVKFSLIANPGWVRSGLNGTGACAFQYPASEGPAFRSKAGFSSVSAKVEVDLPPPFRSGAWYVVRIQRFPDHTCGLAINGEFISRLPASGPPPEHVSIGLSGQTVGTAMLVGPLEAWTGVRTDIAWGAPGEIRPLRAVGPRPVETP